MKTLLALLDRAGGYRPELYLKIENPPYKSLVVEASFELGPMGQPALSVAHYGTLNGDAMRDPEMGFELIQPVGGKRELDPYYWRNDYVAVEQWSRSLVEGLYVALPSLHKEHQEFAKLWDANLRAQGFLDAFSDKSILG